MINDFMSAPRRPKIDTDSPLGGADEKPIDDKPKQGVDTSNLFKKDEDKGVETIPLGESKNLPKPPKQRPHPIKSVKAWFGRLSKKQKILVVTGGILLLAVLVAGGVFAWTKFSNKAPEPTPTVVEEVVAPPKPTTVASPLTGVQVAPELATRAVTGVIIENSPDARPQSGLTDAGIIFEAIAEGGITRFLALFQETQPDYIGPVRSARPYYLDWLVPFDAPLAHVGGAPTALAQIRDQGIKDLDQFYNSAYYMRVSQRYAPHNVYTSMAKLDEAKAAKGYNSSNFTGFPRKDPQPNPAPTATTIDLKISGYLYDVHYDYNTASNTYNRSEGGKPHTDERTGIQISPNVIVAMVIGRGIASDGTHTEYAVNGSGPVFVFQDGVLTQGTWQKSDRNSQITFTDANGQPIKFNPGQTWLTAVDGAANVTHTP